MSGILTIDIGNTATKYALFKGQEVVKYDVNIQSISAFICGEVISNVIISSVNEQALSKIISSLAPLQATIISATTPLPFSIKYSSPTLGADRIAAIAGAYALDYEQPTLIVDAGTCITYDLLMNNQFVGGNIAPGIKMRLEAMHNYTSALPLIEIEQVQNLMGQSTHDAILNGAVYGVIAEMEGIINRLKEEYNLKNILFTGGNGELICSKLKCNINKKYDKFLVLRGLNYIAQYQSK